MEIDARATKVCQEKGRFPNKCELMKWGREDAIKDLEVKNPRPKYHNRAMDKGYDEHWKKATGEIPKRGDL